MLLAEPSELSVGVHTFNFSCGLPVNLPTSFESKYGYIRYQIKIELERPWKFDLKYCFGFTVIKVLDLNHIRPSLRNPLKCETTKNFFLGLSSKSLHISTEIPIRGFVAGQNIPITITVNNKSKIDVKEIQIALKKIIHYNSQTPRKKRRERIELAAECHHTGVPRKSADITVAQLNLPSVPPTNIAFCSVIQSSYEIHVVAKVGGIHWSPVLRLPVTIGTVPLHNYQYAQSSTALESNWNVEASTSSSITSAPLSYFSLSDALSAPYTQDLRKFNFLVRKV